MTKIEKNQKTLKGNRGFTLMEVLIVIALLSTVGLTLTLIFTRTLRGSSKAQVLSEMKQNGQSVLDSVSNVIRSADNVVCPTAGSSANTVVTVKNGTYTRYRLIRPTSGASAANGYFAQDNPVSTTGPLGYNSTMCNDNDALSANFLTLTDRDSVTGVSVDMVGTGAFLVNTPAGYLPTVTVQFMVNPGVAAPTTLSSQITPQTFQTTVQIRDR